MRGQQRYIACHELGHTIGLQHPAAGETLVTCMRSATITPKYVPTYTTTSSVERTQVDACTRDEERGS
ncbi:MAG: zinc-dependent metalloprotease [Chloroflexi bacterium]|nr:zinc-dependent metalloprotease [Chloroflexota bacterium]